jgi:hypothetical protein
VTHGGGQVVVDADEPRARWVAEVAAYAHGWRTGAADDTRVLLRPDGPQPLSPGRPDPTP